MWMKTDDEHTRKKEFMRAMFKVYYSQLEPKFKLVFDMYENIFLPFNLL